MKRSLSITKGKGSIGHNSRAFKADNIDPERSRFNACYVNEDIKQVYHKLFDDALEKYNAKQKRNDRKIPNYYEKIRMAKQEKLFYEIVVQVGDMYDMSAIDDNGGLAAEILDRYVGEFIERNKSLYVFSAHLHMDEATPHLHIDFIPYTSGNTRGLETKNTLKGALEHLGFRGGTRGRTELSQWQNAEKQHLADVMLAYGVEWDKKGMNREHLSVLDFKKTMREQEVAKLDAQLTDIQADLQIAATKKSEITEIDAIETKEGVINKSKVTVDKGVFEDLKILAKKQVVTESKESGLREEIEKLKERGVWVAQENRALKGELSRYQSIDSASQFKIGKLELEVRRLQKLIDKIMRFAEKMGVKQQLEKFLHGKTIEER